VITRNIEIKRATTDDLESLTPLFDGYRQFYRQGSDPEGARRFLEDRLAKNDSIIFLALMGRRALGFTQLYPSFSSVGMARILILNDLFVVPEGRRSGAGSALLAAAAEHGRRAGAVRLVLSTEVDNTPAQALY